MEPASTFLSSTRLRLVIFGLLRVRVIQQIELRNLVTGAECVMRRYWVRVPLTPEDQMRLLAG